MSNIYEVFNTKSEYEFSKFLNKLNLSTNELLNLFSIAESFDTTIKEKQQQILELMAGAKQGNYEICVEQFKPKFKRVLKEAPTMPYVNFASLARLPNRHNNNKTTPNKPIIDDKLNNEQNIKVILNNGSKLYGKFEGNWEEDDNSHGIFVKVNNSLQTLTYPDDYKVYYIYDNNKISRYLEESINSLNLNQVMELNNLMELVSSKLKNPNCMKGIFNIIKSKSSAKVANAFLAMAQQTQINDSNLKFNTELQIDGKNFAQIIYPMKNDIEIFANSLECPKDNQEKKQEKLKESNDVSFNIISELNNTIESSNDKNALKLIITKINDMLKIFNETSAQNTLLSLKTKANTKLAELNNSSPKIEENINQDIVSTACGENTFDNLLNNLTPTFISITVNKNDGEINDDTEQAKNALKALASHINCQKDSCEENNLEELQTINTLLLQLQNYFSKTLTEDTVYDHSWYENDDGNYPKRTKDGVIGLPIKETCSAGATCAANVSGFAKPLGSKPKKKKKISEDIQMFKEYIEQDIPSSLEINGKFISYKIIEGQNYLYIDNAILGTTNKQQILESIDDIYNDCLTIPVYEDFNHIELNLILEDNMENQPNLDNNGEPIDSQKEKDIQNQFNSNNKLKVSINQDNNNTIANQELIGIDDSDESNKLYITKDPISGKVKVVNSNNINVQGQNQ